MFKSNDTYQKGKWVKAADRLPTTQGIKLTLTKDNHLGLAAHADGEWIQFLPTFLGDVERWCEFLDDGGQEIDYSVDEPEPILSGGA